MLPLSSLEKLKNNGIPWSKAWTDKQSLAFKHIKHLMSTAVELHRDGPGTYYLYLDASAYAAGCHLVCMDKGKRYLMGYYSKVFSSSEQNYSTPKCEL